MLSLTDVLDKSEGKMVVYNDYRKQADDELTNKLTICIPDIHLLEEGADDIFYDGSHGNEERFLNFLDFVVKLKVSQGDSLELIQIGDLFDLWRVEGKNPNLIEEHYPSVIGLLDKVLGTIYVVGNHDIDLFKRYANEPFGRQLSYFSSALEKKRVIYQHGWQADFCNNVESWSGTIGETVTLIVDEVQKLYPNADVILGDAWDSISNIFDKYNESLTPVANPAGFNHDNYVKHYIEFMINNGNTTEGDDILLSVVGHTHSPYLTEVRVNGKNYYFMDCGSWTKGHSEIGIIAGRDMAVCQWG